MPDDHLITPTSGRSSVHLTDDQCAQIATWAKRLAVYGHPPEIIVDREVSPGEPIRTPLALYAHPEDYLALQRWADRQEPLRWTP